MEEFNRRLYLSIASTLAWIWGILTLFSAIAIGVPAVSMGKSVGFPLIMLTIGGLYCFSAYGLRKKQRIGAVLALVISGVVLILNIFSPARVSLLAILVNLAIIILVLVSRKETA